MYGVGKFQNIARYLENGTRQAHGYRGTVIGSQRRPIDLCRIQLP